MTIRCTNQFQLDALEPRCLLTVSPVIHLLNGVSEVQVGQAIHVNGVQTGQAIGADLGTGTPLTARYQWDFGDTNPAARFDQLPGFNAAHVYDLPGTYTITLTVTNEAGQVGIAQQLVQIDPAPVNTQIIYVDNTLNASQPDPTGGVDVPSLAAATALMASNTQIYFHTGETFVLNNTISISFNNVTLGAYGDPSLGGAGDPTAGGIQPVFADYLDDGFGAEYGRS